MIECKVTNEKIDLEALMNANQFDKDGAQVLFTGKVRNHNQGKTVTAVSYQAHPKLTEKSFHEIAEECLNKWGNSLSICICHRVGRLSINAISVAILVSSPHRSEAFEACRFIIEQIKVRSPIWKQEHYIDGDSEWLKGHALCGHDSAHSTL